MTAYVLITGTLFRPPEQRTSKYGLPFATATLRVKYSEDVQWWKILAFGESAQAELMRMFEGSAIACQGALRVDTYQTESGETKVSLTCLADSILALNSRPKERKPQEATAPDTRTREERCRGEWRDERDGPNDEIGF